MEANVTDTVPDSVPGSLADPGLNRGPGRDGGRTSAMGRLWTPGRRQLAHQFFRFGVVGAFGFVWDAATVYSLKGVIGLTAAALLAYFVAATANWLMNRFWTFRGVGSASSMIRQWGTFLVANSLGFTLNRGTVLVLIHTVPLCNAHPILALVGGTGAGMFSNFTMSRRLVFR